MHPIALVFGLGRARRRDGVGGVSRTARCTRHGSPLRLNTLGSRHDGVVRHSSVARVPRPCARRPRKRRRGRVYVKRGIEPAHDRRTRTRSSPRPSTSVLLRRTDRHGPIPNATPHGAALGARTNGARGILGLGRRSLDRAFARDLQRLSFARHDERRPGEGAQVLNQPACSEPRRVMTWIERSEPPRSLSHPRRGTSEVGDFRERLLQPRQRRVRGGSVTHGGESRPTDRGASEPIARSGAR